MADPGSAAVIQCPPMEGLVFIKGDPCDVPNSSGPVLLETWATWCRICPKGFPATSQLQQRFGPQGLRVVAVCIEPDEQLARRFMEQHDADMQFAVAMDTKGEASALMQAVGTKEVPHAFFIDTQGVVQTHNNPMRLSFKVDVANFMRQHSGQPGSPSTPAAVRGGGGGVSGAGGEQDASMLLEGRLPSCDMSGHCE